MDAGLSSERFRGAAHRVSHDILYESDRRELMTETMKKTAANLMAAAC